MAITIYNKMSLPSLYVTDGHELGLKGYYTWSCNVSRTLKVEKKPLDSSGSGDREMNLAGHVNSEQSSKGQCNEYIGP